MLSFVNDYSEGAHEQVLRRLAETNREQHPGYGTDPYCARAKEKIRRACGCPEGDVFFLVGGTQTNQAVISALLAPWEGVIAPATGHICTHEAGAIEATGHKVLELPQREGKLSVAELRTYLEGFYGDENHEHMVFPGMVYLSWPTELGTLYTRAELGEIHQVCRQYKIPLYLDGARMGYGLASRGSGMTLADLAASCDVFYIGGTKVGALFGEAVVFPRHNAPGRFMTAVKQRGALLAKGWLLGVQFDALFTDDLYFKISRHADEMAYQIRDIFVSAGYPLLFDSPTNQQYPIMPDEELAILGKNFGYEYWERTDPTHSGVRFCASWATTQENVDALRAAVQALKK